MIKNVQEYQELVSMTDTAEECLQSLRFGEHAKLIRLLYVKHGIRTDRLGAIREARRLCNEFLNAYEIE